MTLAHEEAKRHRHKYIRTEHVLLALIDYDSTRDELNLHVPTDCIRKAIAMMHCPTCDAEEKMELSASARRAIERIQSPASLQPITVLHLVYSILQSSVTVPRILSTCGVDITALAAWLESEIAHDK